MYLLGTLYCHFNMGEWVEETSVIERLEVLEGGGVTFGEQLRAP